MILRHWQNNKKAKDPKDITNRVLVHEARDLGLNPNKPLYLSSWLARLGAKDHDRRHKCTHLMLAGCFGVLRFPVVVSPGCLLRWFPTVAPPVSLGARRFQGFLVFTNVFTVAFCGHFLRLLPTVPFGFVGFL